MVFPSEVLVLLGGCLVFVLGVVVGMGVFSRVLAERERQLSRERRAVNGVWRRLYRLTGVRRQVWMTDFRNHEAVDVISADESFDED